MRSSLRSTPQLFLPLMFTLAIGLAGGADAQLRLPSVIGDHMVLQRDSEVPLWGQAEPGEKVTVSPDWSRDNYAAVTDAKGKWRVSIATPPAGGPFSIKIQGKTELTLSDILIGEVWVASGQSNMEWSLSTIDASNQKTEGYESEVDRAHHARIRLFGLNRRVAISPRDDCEGQWRRCEPDSVRNFSAVAYFFGRKLQAELGVPIGLIGTYWGGTPAESWTREKEIAALGDFDGALQKLKGQRLNAKAVERDYRDKVAAWEKAVAAVDRGQAEKAWYSTDLADSGWRSTSLPGTFKGGGLEGFDGVVWYRKGIDLPPAWNGRAAKLELGAIDDKDRTWINGVKVGATEGDGDWQTPRVYEIPKGVLRAGFNVISVRVYDRGGVGGFTGKDKDMKLGVRGGESLPSVSLAGPWRWEVGLDKKDMPEQPRSSRPGSHTPTGLYNGMIAPVLPFGIKGAIWYQGESNRDRPEQYRRLFPAMIQSWRRAWGQGDFPFYFVQIAPYNYGAKPSAAYLREAQTMTLSLPKTGMAVITDIGNPRNIHPKNKIDVGDRLARWALAKDYGRRDLVHSGPLYRSMTKKGRTIRLSFDHVGGGLAARGGALTDFTIAGADKRFYPARATIEGNVVIVDSPEVAQPVAVRFGWEHASEPNFFNREGLPASTFRTDDWPVER